MDIVKINYFAIKNKIAKNMKVINIKYYDVRSKTSLHKHMKGFFLNQSEKNYNFKKMQKRDDDNIKPMEKQHEQVKVVII